MPTADADFAPGCHPEASLLRTTLLALSHNAALRHFLENNALGRRFSRRFIAGLTLDDAMTAVAALNRSSLTATLDPLGENVTTEAAAAQAASSAGAILEAIHDRHLAATLSLKLTQLGLDLDLDLARAHLRRILDCARERNIFIRVDMEGSAYTETTLALVEQFHGEGYQVGTVLQACLHRTAADLDRLLAADVSIRLVKGAYREPADIALQQKSDVDANYLRLLQRLLARPGANAIATHDERMIRATVACARQLQRAPDSFEFQMLYGIRRDLQQKLRAQGWQVRVYTPFGPQWYPYFMRRLAERPANLIFLLRNLLR